MNYLLDGKKAVPEPDLRKWAIEYGRMDRRVALTDLHDQGITISTVFLGIDHNWGEGPPILFETMVFKDKPGGPPWDGDEVRCERTSTWEEAEAMHKQVVEELING